MSISVQSDISNKLLNRIASRFPFSVWRHSKVVVGVSGGADSVALVTLLQQLAAEQSQNANSPLHIVHCDHATRSNSNQDAEFVRRLAGRLGLPFILCQRTDDASQGDSEEVLRNFRYRALVDTAHQIGARYVVTGHNRDDQIETILFRLFRGTGLSGLCGIPPTRVAHDITIVRPMLEIARAEVLEYLREGQLSFVEDTSNADQRYSRNFIRHEVLPLIKSRFGNVTQSMLGLVEQAQQNESLLDSIADGLDIACTANPNTLDVRPFANQPSLVVIHKLKELWRNFNYSEQAMTQEKWNQLAELTLSDSDGSIQLPGRITAKRQGNFVALLPTTTQRSS